MKRKLTSLFLLLVMYLNIVGYYWVLVGLHYNSTLSLEKKLNNEDYSEGETITFKFHLTLPYTLGEPGFERAEGQFVYNGEYYHLVKQRYVNDTLQLVCIKNPETKRISVALNDFVKTFADQSGNLPTHAKNFPGFIKDYLMNEFSVAFLSAGWMSELRFSRFNARLSTCNLPLITQPPELC